MLCDYLVVLKIERRISDEEVTITPGYLVNSRPDHYRLYFHGDHYQCADYFCCNHPGAASIFNPIHSSRSFFPGADYYSGAADNIERASGIF